MKQRIWFVSHYSMPPQYEMRIKTQMYAHILNELDYETKIFSASTLHNTNINLINDHSLYITEKYNDLDFVHIKCHNYKGNGLKRIFNMQEFAYKFTKVAKNFTLPDVVIADINCTNYASICRFCKKYNILFFIDIRDLWPESIVAYTKYTKNNPIIKHLYYQEKKMYEQADAIIFTIEGGRDYIIEKGWDTAHGGSIDLNKVHHINNGVDLETYNYNKEHYTFADSDLDDPNSFKVIYTGSIRKANNLDLIINAAKYVFSVNQKIKILLFGSGVEKEALEQKCLKEGINNVTFKGSVKKQYIPYILSKANLNILNYSYHDIWKYGGSQNKLFEYFASGKPVLSTIRVGYDLITRYSAGISLNDQSAESIGNAILNISRISASEYNRMCQNSLQAAQDYDYKALTNILLKILQKNKNENSL